MTRDERFEFRLFLIGCTPKQLLEVLRKEREAGRYDYAEVVVQELADRGVRRG